MAVTKDELHAFQRFADERLNSGSAGSLVELVDEWEAQRREAEATLADIRQSHADIEAGRVSSVADAFAEARRQLETK